MENGDSDRDLLTTANEGVDYSQEILSIKYDVGLVGDGRRHHCYTCFRYIESNVRAVAIEAEY